MNVHVQLTVKQPAMRCIEAGDQQQQVQRDLFCLSILFTFYINFIALFPGCFLSQSATLNMRQVHLRIFVHVNLILFFTHTCTCTSTATLFYFSCCLRPTITNLAASGTLRRYGKVSERRCSSSNNIQSLRYWEASSLKLISNECCSFRFSH